MPKMMLESFSAGYWLAPEIDVTTHAGTRAIIQDDLFYELVFHTMNEEIVCSTGGTHFELHPERAVPDNLVAVPEDSQYAARDNDALLIAKQNGREVFQFG